MSESFEKSKSVNPAIRFFLNQTETVSFEAFHAIMRNNANYKDGYYMIGGHLYSAEFVKQIFTDAEFRRTLEEQTK